MDKLNKKKEIDKGRRKLKASKSAAGIDTNNSKTKSKDESQKATNPQQQGRTKKAMKKDKSKSKFVKNNKGISAEEEEDLFTSKQPVNLLSRRCSQDNLYAWVSDDDDDFWDDAKYDQKLVQRSASFYRVDKYYGSEHDERTCIWSGGSFKWSEKTSGIPWVGVNGTDVTIVVAMSSERNDRQDGRRCWTQMPADVYILVPLCDMGVWADTTTASTGFRRKLIALNSSKENVGPFALVNIPPRGTTDDHLEITHRDKAVEFLENKLKGRSALIFEEVKLIAVCALKLLVGQKFDSNMVEQRVCGNAKGPRIRVRISAAEVEEQLAAIDQT